MPKLMTIAWFAGALAVAGFPASAVDLPDYGSKNFSPSGDTPTYFTNEAAPVSTRTADVTQRDWSAVDAMAPAGGAANSYVDTGRGNRHAAAGRSGRHGFGKVRHGAHQARSLHASSAPARVAGKRPVWAVTTGSSVSRSQVSAARTTSAKHGKANARHVRAGATTPTKTSRMASLSN